VFIKRAVVIQHRSQALAVVGLSGAFFGLDSDAFLTVAVWSHTSFCFIRGTLLSLLVLVTVRKPRPPRWFELILFGLADGVLTSIQLCFAPWVIGTAVSLTVAAQLRGIKVRYAMRRAEAITVWPLWVFCSQRCQFTITISNSRPRYSLSAHIRT
jgi:hypothetical protein